MGIGIKERNFPTTINTELAQKKGKRHGIYMVDAARRSN
jgi:hypothetical protein